MKPFVPKSSSPSVLETLITKPTRGKLRSCMEMLAKKKRSVKRKPPSSPKGYPPTRGKILKVGASSSPSPAVGAGGSLRRADEPPLEVLPISVWSPSSRGGSPPPAMPNEVTGNRDHFEAAGVEDSLLSHAELAVRVISSILRDSDLRKVGALPVEEALALLLQRNASVRPSAFVDFFLYYSILLADFFFFFFFWQVATYVKGIARRASLTEGSARAMKSYKAKVASLTSERVCLQAQIRELTEELVKHKSDLKHALVARARDEDKEKEARKDAKVVEDELQLAKEELQAVKGDLWAKMAALEQARQEALEAGNTVEFLTEELGRLRMDLAR